MPTTGPKVSVIMPARNAAAYLEQAIESARRQAFTDWELLVTDDGSTDATAEIARGLGATVLTHVEARGAGAARNTAIAAASGELLAFLDADDVWEPLFLRVAMQSLATSGAALFCANGRVIDSSGQPGAPLFIRSPLRATPCATWRKMADVSFLCPSQVVVRRSALPSPMPFDPAMSPAEDWDLWLTLLEGKAPFVYSSEILMNYRRHEGNTSGSGSGDRHHAAQRRVLRKHYNHASSPFEKATYLRTLARLETDRALRDPSPQGLNTLRWAVSRHPGALFDLLVQPRLRSAARKAMVMARGLGSVT